MNLRERIRMVLREEKHIPSVIKRRISPEDLEDAFKTSLEENSESLNNPNSILYKETLWYFAEWVIDEMVRLLEQDLFTDGNRIYFDIEEDFYRDKIRKPLLRYYGSRIKERYNEIK